MSKYASQTGMIRQWIRVTGRVQGVGFRFRAKYAANMAGLSGWVKNEWDGSVVMEVQGTLDQINLLLKRINQSDYIQIDRMERKNIPLEETGRGFHVR